MQSFNNGLNKKLNKIKSESKKMTIHKKKNLDSKSHHKSNQFKVRFISYEGEKNKIFILNHEYADKK